MLLYSEHLQILNVFTGCMHGAHEILLCSKHLRILIVFTALTVFLLYSDNLRCFDCIQSIYDVFDCIWRAHEMLLYSEHLRILIVFKALTMARLHWDQKPLVLSRILELSADWAKRSRGYHVTHSR